jgi:GNAT superfamily N-acetyltransferase
MKKLLFLLLLPLAINSMDMPKTDITYEGPQLAYNQKEHEINAMDSIWTVGRIMYEYVNGSAAEITLFSVDQDFQNKGIGKELFQKCIEDIIAHNCTQICWTINPVDNIDVETLRIIYHRLINKLENSESYQLSSTDIIENNKAKIKMILTLKED